MRERSSSCVRIASLSRPLGLLAVNGRQHVFWGAGLCPKGQSGVDYRGACMPQGLGPRPSSLVARSGCMKLAGDLKNVTVRQALEPQPSMDASAKRARAHSGPSVAPSALSLDAAGILSLQRLAGNQAVSSMIEVQRYEAGERAQFGAETGKPERQFVLRLGSPQITSGYGDVQAAKDDPNTLVMSYGEVIALGDLYKDFGELRLATSSKERFTELQGLVRLVRQDVTAYTPGHPGATPVTNEQSSQRPRAGRVRTSTSICRRPMPNTLRRPQASCPTMPKRVTTRLPGTSTTWLASIKQVPVMSTRHC